jgi:hypothetical protein
VLVVLGAMAFASSPPLHPISKLPSTLLRLLPDEKTLGYPLGQVVLPELAGVGCAVARSVYAVLLSEPGD